MSQNSPVTPVEPVKMDSNAPKSGPINRIKNAQKDSIPINKTPKRQRSSRFHVSEKVELEKLANLKGTYVNFT